jgi:pyridoxine 5-phosphate synthase
MSQLVVRIDQVAALRSGRKASSPDPVVAAVLAESAGADGIAAHLWEDRRHIQDRDVRLLKEVIQNRFVLIMGMTAETAAIALEIQPDRVTLVPEKRDEFSLHGALDIVVHQTIAAETVQMLREGGIPAAVFIDPDLDQVKVAHQMKAAMVEINTLPFCNASTSIRRGQILSKITDSLKMAHKLKMGIVLGRGLCRQTIRLFSDFREIDEFCMGHGVISRSILVGMEKAVSEIRRCLHRP